MALLEIRDLVVRLPYGAARPLVDGVAIDVEAGEIVGLVGESGSGKSLTARAALGLFPAGASAEGEIFVDGSDVIGASGAVLHRVRTSVASMIFQDPRAGINPMRRIGDFLTESVRTNQGWSRAKAKASSIDLLRAVGLPDPERHFRQYPHELSGGMLQRVMIAAALTSQPRLLLCDEPTTALDVTTQAEIVAIIAKLRTERDLGVLFITHDLDLAAAICDRIYVMYAGEIVETAAATTLFASPRHPYTAGLLSSTPKLDAGDEPLTPVKGTPLGLHESPPGCRFFGRCPEALPDTCDTERPQLFSISLTGASQGSAVRCVRAREIGSAQTALPPVPAGSATGVAVRKDRTTDAAVVGDGSVPLLEARTLRKVYWPGGVEVVAVAGLSFQLARGGSLGLVGESGSGKTTVARMLVGLEAPDSGEILVEGQPAGGGSRKAGRLARAAAAQIVFQDPYLSLDPRICVADALDDVLRLHSDLDRPGRRARTAELLDQVGLGHREAKEVPRNLSGGQRQRVAIARALAVRPAVLVLDEAVSALDVSVQAQVLNLLVDIRRETGIGLLFISHDLAVIRYLCSDAIVMYRGVDVERQPTEVLLSDPKHPYTRLLVDSVPRSDWDPARISDERRELLDRVR